MEFRPRDVDGEAHDFDALAAEDFVEGGSELGVTIPEKELGRESTVLEFPGQIASLLHHPLRARVVGAAGEVHATAADLNKEGDVELGHPDGVDHEEVTGEHLVGVLAYEGSPGALTAPRRWAEAMAAEDPDHGQVRAAHAELEQLTLDAAISPARVLLSKSNDGLAPGASIAGLRAARPRSVGCTAPADQFAMPSQQCLRAGEQR